MDVSTEALAEVERALDIYINEVEASPLQRATNHAYLHAHDFVRWLKGRLRAGREHA